MIWRACATCSALDLRELARADPQRILQPDAQLPPIAAAIAAMASGGCAAPSTDQWYWSPNSRSAVRFMCMTSSGCGPMPPRMPNTDWTKKRRLDQPAIDEMRQRVEMADVVALDLEARAVLGAGGQDVFDVLRRCS